MSLCCCDITDPISLFTGQKVQEHFNLLACQAQGEQNTYYIINSEKECISSSYCNTQS
jgi:hypothetical protein